MESPRSALEIAMEKICKALNSYIAPELIKYYSPEFPSADALMLFGKGPYTLESFSYIIPYNVKGLYAEVVSEGRYGDRVYFLEYKKEYLAWPGYHQFIEIDGKIVVLGKSMKVGGNSFQLGIRRGIIVLNDIYPDWNKNGEKHYIRHYFKEWDPGKRVYYLPEYGSTSDEAIRYMTESGRSWSAWKACNWDVYVVMLLDVG